MILFNFRNEYEYFIPLVDRRDKMVFVKEIVCFFVIDFHV